jgi:hypothetical protein
MNSTPANSNARRMTSSVARRGWVPPTVTISTPARSALLAPIKESASFAGQISLALTIKRRHVAAQRQTTIGVRWARLGLADTFGVYFCWRPFKGNLGAQSTLRKSRPRQWLSTSEHQSRSERRRTFDDDDPTQRNIRWKEGRFLQGEMKLSLGPVRHPQSPALGEMLPTAPIQASIKGLATE